MKYFFTATELGKNDQQYMVHALTIIWSVVTGAIVTVGFYFFPHLWTRWITFIGISLFIAAVNLTLNRRGHTHTASWSLTTMLWLYITIPCYSAGGILAPGILTQMSVILTAGFLLGWRGGLIFGLLTLGTDFGLAYMEATGHLPSPTVVHTPITRWISAIIPFSTILALQYYATNRLRNGLLALKDEIQKRQNAEKIKDHTLHTLSERVKELKTLYDVSRLLQEADTPPEELYQQVVEALPGGWQHADISSANLQVGTATYTTLNYQSSEYLQIAEMATAKGTKVCITVAYSQKMPEYDEGPFLQEERNLINMLVEMLKVDLERRERRSELKDYKYALDIASSVSISEVDGSFSFVNENFCKANKYKPEELLGQQHSIIASGFHSAEYFINLGIAMQDGKPYRGEFCNKAKDGTTYWVDSSIVPFLDENGKVYQYLSINYDITERKVASEKVRQSEQLLRKITSLVPSNTYMFELDESGHSNILFMNRGTEKYNHSYDLDGLGKHHETIREIIHADDKVKFNNAMKKAFQTQSTISFQYRVVLDDEIRWRWVQAIPEKEENGRIVWYGVTSDVTPIVEYIVSIEQVIFDIGHIIRRPISSMKGMTQLIFDSDLDEKETKEVSKKLHLISEEMDKYILELNRVYHTKRQDTKLNIDISSLIDKRSSLFN